MDDELLNFSFPTLSSNIIKVVGVGGGGCNAVSHMYQEGITGVDFILCNTDAQAMQNSSVPVKIQLGVTLTEGRGAGNRPEMGEEAAKENYDDIKQVLEGGTKMVFITAGMGGGTGTGAAPVIAGLCRELGILTIAVVTIPSPAEGKKRLSQAVEGIEKLRDYVDSMLVISNKKLQNIYGDLPARQAFKMADNIVATAVKGVAEIITVHGNINIDFTDVSTVMSESKVFIMGTGYASGENRAINAINQALESPLLDNNNINGAQNILLNIISGQDEITMGEIGYIIDKLQERAGQDADIIWGNGYDESLGDQISVTILATGFKTKPINTEANKPEVKYELNFKPSENNFFNEDIEEEQQPQPEVKEEPVLADFDLGPELEIVGRGAPEPKEPVKKKKRREREPATADHEGNVDNWFFRKFNFNKLFEDDDNA
jgi:cell division protein FtsZ